MEDHSDALTQEERRILEGLEEGRTLKAGIKDMEYVASLSQEGDPPERIGERVDMKAVSNLYARGLLEIDLPRIDPSQVRWKDMAIERPVTATRDDVTGAGRRALQSAEVADDHNPGPYLAAPKGEQEEAKSRLKAIRKGADLPDTDAARRAFEAAFRYGLAEGVDRALDNFVRPVEDADGD